MQYYQLAADQGYEAAKVNLKNLLEQHPHLKYQQPTHSQAPFFSSSSSGAAAAVATSVTTTTAMTNVTPSSPPTLY